jgi:hypothetical protein
VSSGGPAGAPADGGIRSTGVAGTAASEQRTLSDVSWWTSNIAIIAVPGSPTLALLYGFANKVINSRGGRESCPGLESGDLVHAAIYRALEGLIERPDEAEIVASVTPGESGAVHHEARAKVAPELSGDVLLAVRRLCRSIVNRHKSELRTKLRRDSKSHLIATRQATEPGEYAGVMADVVAAVDRLPKMWAVNSLHAIIKVETDVLNEKFSMSSSTFLMVL